MNEDYDVPVTNHGNVRRLPSLQSLCGMQFIPNCKQKVSLDLPHPSFQTKQYIVISNFPSFMEEHHWFSGKISRCHRDALGSIPGWCSASVSFLRIMKK